VIPRDVLLARAVSYTGVGPASSEDAITRAVNQLAGRSARVPRSPHGSFRYPRGPLLEPFERAIIERHSDLGTHGITMLFDLLTRPLRAYEMSDAQDEMRRIVHLAAVISDEETPQILVGDLAIPHDRTHWAKAGFTLTVVSSDDDAVPGVLEELAGKVSPAQRGHPDPDHPHPDKILWLGGSAAEVRTPDWRDGLYATAVVRGFTLEVLEQPARHHAEVIARLDSFSGPIMVIWTPYAGRNYGAYVDAATGAEVFHVHAASYDEARAFFRDELEAFLELFDAKDAADGNDEGRDLPSQGEVRHYKKHFSRRRGGDKMLDWHDCGHDRWAGAYAPQARLGIAKLEDDTPIARLEKCLSCTGGGVWRVTFE